MNLYNGFAKHKIPLGAALILLAQTILPGNTSSCACLAADTPTGDRAEESSDSVATTPSITTVQVTPGQRALDTTVPANTHGTSSTNNGKGPCDGSAEAKVYGGTCPAIPGSQAKLEIKCLSADTFCFKLQTPSVTIDDWVEATVVTYYPGFLWASRAFFDHDYIIPPGQPNAGTTVALSGDILLHDEGRAVLDLVVGNAPEERYLLKNLSQYQFNVSLMPLDILKFYLNQKHTAQLSITPGQTQASHALSGTWKVRPCPDYSFSPSSGTFNFATGQTDFQIVVTNLRVHTNPVERSFDVVATPNSVSGLGYTLPGTTSDGSVTCTMETVQCGLTGTMFELHSAKAIKLFIDNPGPMRMTGNWEIVDGNGIYQTPVKGTYSVASGQAYHSHAIIKNLAAHGAPHQLKLQVTAKQAAPGTATAPMYFEPPKITKIESKYTLASPGKTQPERFALYLTELKVNEPYTVTVDWRSHTPGQVVFIKDGVQLPGIDTGGGNSASMSFDMGTFPQDSKLEAKAISADATPSAVYESAASFMNRDPLDRKLDLYTPLKHNAGALKELQYTAGPFKMSLFSLALSSSAFETLPAQEGKGWSWAPSFSVKYTVSGSKKSGSVETEIGIGKFENGWESSKPTVPKCIRRFLQNTGPRTLGVEVTGGVALEGDWALPKPKQWEFDGGKFGILGSATVKIESFPGTSIGIPPIAIPIYWAGKLGATFAYIAGITNMSGAQPGASQWIGEFRYSPTAEIEGGIGVPKIVTGGAYLGGKVDTKIAIPRASWGLLDGLLQQLDFVLTGGLRVGAFLWKYSIDIVECKLAVVCEENCPTYACNLPFLGSKDGQSHWEPMDRFYVDKDFALFQPHSPSGLRGTQHSVEQTLVLNEFPQPAPELVRCGNNLVMVWLTDDTGRDSLDRTSVVFSADTGLGWSPPAPVDDDGTLDFDPQLAVADGDNVIAAWTNCADTNGEEQQPEDAAAIMEISVAHYNVSSNAWTTPITLTSNGYLDFKPRLAADDDGTAMLVWLTNHENDFFGGTFAHPNDIMYSRFDGISWSTPAVAATNVPSVLNLDLAYNDYQAALFFSGDADADLVTAGDIGLYATTFNGTSWSAISALSTSAELDTNPKPWYNEHDELNLVWYRDGDLMFAAEPDLSDATVVVDAQGVNPGVADFVLATDDAGRAALVWSDVSTDFVDLWFSFFDPLENSWSAAGQLTTDHAAEHYISATLDDNSNLVAVYAKQAFITETRVVSLNEVDYDVDVPVPDQADLAVVYHSFFTDLAIDSNGITIEPFNPKPGETATITAQITNTGDFPVSDVDVAFYDGDPLAGGTLVDLATELGPIAGGGSALLEVDWVVPAAAVPRDIYVVVDPYQQQAEADITNNTAFITALGPDLLVSEMWLSQPTACTRIINFIVTNSGAVPTAATTVTVQSVSTNGPLVACLPLPPLAGGNSAELSTLWTGPAVGEGVRPRVVVTVDPDDLIYEVEEYNNLEYSYIDLNAAGAGDCNTNGVADDCDLLLGTSTDCDTNGVPDECQVAPLCLLPGSTCQDCQSNGVVDLCDILTGASFDLNTNGVPDECEDCNSNGIIDEFDIASGSSDDCDSNGLPDECDLAAGHDADADGVIDDCDNCPQYPNNDQADLDGDQIGDACDIDADGDAYAGPSGDNRDCDDFQPLANPGLSEEISQGNCADGIDNDCDGYPDSTDPDC